MASLNRGLERKLFPILNLQIWGFSPALRSFRKDFDNLLLAALPGWATYARAALQAAAFPRIG